MPEGQKSRAGFWTVKKTLESQLAELGLKPSDINYVALSHSHGDHVGNLKLFPDATLLVQKPEWEWRPPVGASPFHPWMKAITPNGDHDLFGDGSIVLIATHGHSPGHQNLLVRLPKTGAIMLTGDSVHTKANWDSAACRKATSTSRNRSKRSSACAPCSRKRRPSYGSGMRRARCRCENIRPRITIDR